MNNRITIYIFGVLTAVWLSEFFLFPSRLQISGRGGKSFYLILGSIIISILFSVISYLNSIFIIEGAAGKVMSYSGLIIYSAALFLRYWSINSLGENFSRGVKVSKEQRLVVSGPYRKMRHPLYLSLFLLVCGVAIFLKSLPGLLISVVLISFSLRIRIREEEALMKKVIGKSYINWLQKRWII